MTGIQNIKSVSYGYDIPELKDKSEINENKELQDQKTPLEIGTVGGSPEAIQSGALSDENKIRQIIESGDYSIKIKEKLALLDVEEKDAYTQIAMELKRVIEEMLGTVTNEDIKKVLMDQYNPEKISIDIFANIIKNNKVAIRTNDLEKLQREIDEEVKLFEEKFREPETLKVIITKLKENNLPANQKNIEKLLLVAQKLEKLQANISEDSVVQLLKQNKEITLEALYKAQFTRSQPNKDSSDIENLLPQIKELLIKSGLEVNEKNIEIAKKLISENIPLDENNLERMKQIMELETRLTLEEVVDQAVKNIADKKAPANIPISATNNTPVSSPVDSAKNQAIIDGLQEIDRKAIERVVRQDIEINLQQLFKGSKQHREIEETKESQKYEEAQELKVIRANLAFEEIRLKMTLEAANQISKKGIEIETQPLEELVAHLRELEAAAYQREFEQAGMKATREEIQETAKVFEALELAKSIPPQTVKKLAKEELSFTLESIEKDIRLETIEKAMKNYQASETKVRTDLGDKLEKTFSQIEDHLSDLGLEKTDSNIRAVKILAMNQMELTLENIEAVKIVDLKVMAVTQGLEPKIVVKMIHENLSPIKMHVDEILDYFKGYQEELGTTTQEQIAKSILELESSANISPEEREGLVGIYRMLLTISRSKGAAAGFLVKNNLPLHMNNLFEAAKYLKQTKGQRSQISADIDDGFGILSELKYQGKSISEQISLAYKEAAIDSFLAPENIQKIKKLYQEGYFKSENIDLEDLLEALKSDPNKEMKEGIEKESKELFERVKDLSKVDIETIKNMERFGLEKNLKNLLTAQKIKESPFTFTKELEMLIKEENLEPSKRNFLKEAVEGVSKNEKIDELEKDFVKIKEKLEDLEESIFQGNHSPSQKAYKSIEESINTLDYQRALQKNENYYQIPLVLNGRLTQMNLYFRENKENQKNELSEEFNIFIYFDTQNMGRVQAKVSLVKDKMNFSLYTQDPGDMEYMRAFEKEIKELIGKTPYQLDGLQFGYFEGESPISEGIQEEEVQEKRYKESKFETRV